MTNQDLPLFLQAMTAMTVVYRQDCSEILLDTYFEALRDLPVEQVVAAVKGLLKTMKFMPVPADIREAIEGPAPKTSPAERAWTRLLEMVEKCHQCNRVECDDPALAKAVNVIFGFWDRAVHRFTVESLDEIDRAVLRKDFCAAYENAMAEGVPTSGRSILRLPQGNRRPGHVFMLGAADRRGVRVLTGLPALDWLNRAALPPAPAAMALVAHEEDA